jgi:hypothetical protein
MCTCRHAVQYITRSLERVEMLFTVTALRIVLFSDITWEFPAWRLSFKNAVYMPLDQDKIEPLILS